MPLTEAAISAIGAAAAAGISTAGSLGAQAAANRRQYKNWLRQNMITRQQYLEDREYNSPEAQMERYKAAGLNPNLIYGQDNSTSVQSPVNQIPYDSSAQYVAAGLSNLQSAIDTYLKVKRQEKDFELIDSMIAKNAEQQRDFKLKADLNLLKWTAFDKEGYFTSIAKKAMFGALAADTQQRFNEAAFDYKLGQIKRIYTWFGLRNEAQRIENAWNFPKSRLPFGARYNMWKNIAAQKGWLGTDLMKSQYNLNVARLGNVLGQTDLYKARQSYTQMKQFFLPFQIVFEAASLLGK